MALPAAGDDLTAALLRAMFTTLLGDYASHSSVSGNETTTSATFTNLATSGPAVTITSQGTLALVIFGAMQYVSSEASYGSAVSVAVSGATTIAAAEGNKLAATEGPIGEGAAGCQFVLMTITPGSNTYTMKYRVGNAAITGNFSQRRMWVFAP